jgi:hypothetical protein
MKLNINTDATVAFTNKLEKMHKSALPSAVRGALNMAVNDVKTNTMPATAGKAFTNRQPNFFKANSKFENASGFNIASMKASVGFVETGLKGNNYSVKELEDQEYGGTIHNKSFIPKIFARKGGARNGLVKPSNRLSGITNIIKAKNSKGKNDREKFVIASVVAGKGGFVLYKDILWRIDSLAKSNIKKRFAIVKRTPLYSFRKGRNVKVQQTGFMRKASLESASKLEDFYIKEAERQFQKFKR